MYRALAENAILHCRIPGRTVSTCSVVNGEEARLHLLGESPYCRTEFPMPAIIVSELALPRCNGFELLQWVRRHPQFARIPFAVFALSIHPADVSRAYECGANAVFHKPADYTAMSHWVETVVS